jgi:hypothetical protein
VRGALGPFAGLHYARPPRCRSTLITLYVGLLPASVPMP